MPAPADRPRAGAFTGLASLAVLACAACCAIPMLLAAGVFSGVTWAALGGWIPGIALVLAALAGVMWRRRSRRHRHRGGCPGGQGCSC
jgi:mercuric ion transport protein